MFRAVSLAYAMMLVLLHTLDAEQFPPLPTSVQSTLNEALRFVSKTYCDFGKIADPSEIKKKISEAGQSFSETLGKLAGQIDDKLAERMKPFEGQSIEAKLIAISINKAKRPEIYEEIQRIYVTGVLDPRARILAPPHPRPSHLTEEYRLAWEYHLLAPPPSEAKELYDYRIREALRRIKSNASLITLLYSYRSTCHEWLYLSTAESIQSQLLSTIDSFCSDQALFAILQCLSASKGQRYREGPIPSSWNPEQHVYHLLTDQQKLGTGEKWRNVIEAFPKENLPPDQCALLDKVLEKK